MRIVWITHACAPADEVLAGLGDGVPEVAVKARPRGEDVVKRLARVGAPEGRQAGQHDVHDHACGPNIGRVAVLAAQHLWRYVEAAAHHVPQLLACAHDVHGIRPCNGLFHNM